MAIYSKPQYHVLEKAFWLVCKYIGDRRKKPMDVKIVQKIFIEKATAALGRKLEGDE